MVITKDSHLIILGFCSNVCFCWIKFCIKLFLHGYASKIFIHAPLQQSKYAEWVLQWSTGNQTWGVFSVSRPENSPHLVGVCINNLSLKCAIMVGTCWYHIPNKMLQMNILHCHLKSWWYGLNSQNADSMKSLQNNTGNHYLMSL